MKKNQCYPTDLTDCQWDCIKELIPPAKSGGHPRTLEMRAVVNAIMYLLVTGCQWRMLPREYPAWQSVYTYFRRWRDDGTWQRLHDTLRAQVRERAGRHKHPTAAVLDSQSVKMSHVPGVRGYDAGKKINGRKRHILVDTLGLLMAVIVTSAALSDPAGAKCLFKRLGGACKKLRRIWVDGCAGYLGHLFGKLETETRFSPFLLLWQREPPAKEYENKQTNTRLHGHRDTSSIRQKGCVFSWCVEGKPLRNNQCALNLT